jgi:hypothetical protein
MNKLATIALTALVATTAIVGTARGAQAGCGYADNGAEYCVSHRGGNNYEVTVDDKYNGTGYIMFANCDTGTWRARAITGWSQAELQTAAENLCRQV